MNKTLSYQGYSINIEDDRLNLTDMWKASGSIANKEPYEWLRSKQAQELIQRLETVTGNSRNGLVVASKGGDSGGGGTWAHWQIGFAYAKYLSADFHIWCNTVVRAYMEGRSSTLAERVPTKILPEQIAAVDRVDAMAHALVAKGLLSEEQAYLKIIDAMKLYMGFDMTTSSTSSFAIQPVTPAQDGITVHIPKGSGPIAVRPIPARDGFFYMSQWLDGENVAEFGPSELDISKALVESLRALFTAQGRTVSSPAGYKVELGRALRAIGVWPYSDECVLRGDYKNFCRAHSPDNTIARDGVAKDASKPQRHVMVNQMGISLAVDHVQTVLLPAAPEEKIKRAAQKAANDKARREREKIARAEKRAAAKAAAAAAEQQADTKKTEEEPKDVVGPFENDAPIHVNGAPLLDTPTVPEQSN